jgi:hypothetical protein
MKKNSGLIVPKGMIGDFDWGLSRSVGFLSKGTRWVGKGCPSKGILRIGMIRPTRTFPATDDCPTGD